MLIERFPVKLGKEVSKNERESRNMEDTTLTYGEVEFASLGQTFYKIKNNFDGIPEGTFYDLGSGTGKGCLSAALLHPFVKCVGIEILEGLYNTSLELKDTYSYSIDQYVADNPEMFLVKPAIGFIKADFFS
jgi:hypothetical protein